MFISPKFATVPEPELSADAPEVVVSASRLYDGRILIAALIVLLWRLR